MDNRQVWQRLAFVMFLVAALGLGACSSKTTGGGGGSGGTLPPGTGICSDTCERDCTTDQDCDMTQGDLCCDLSPAGKSCMKASECPRACTTDTQCDMTSGLVCARVSLSISQDYCASPASGLQFCQSDNDCSIGNTCCSIYNQPICLPPSQCPNACATSADCKTTSGEICCTSVGSLEPTLVVPGLCLNPLYEPCPQTCTSSSNCTSMSAPLCCNGLCSDTCAKTCTQSTDCTNQICCKSAWQRLSSQQTKIFTASPTCMGTADSCSTCAYYGGCGCPGCSSAGGTCSGTPYSCSLCGEYSSCSLCPGCAPSNTGSCTGTAYPCSYYDYYSSYYCTQAGCTWDSTTSLCQGTPTPCSALTSETTCDASSYCYWSSGDCTGTPTPCSQVSSTNCSYNPGCSSVTTCTGTATPCSQLSSATCSNNPGCIASPVTSCTGTATPCSQLSPETCSSNPGCQLYPSPYGGGVPH